MKYRKGYKYQVVVEDESLVLPDTITFGKAMYDDYLRVAKLPNENKWELTVKIGYAWDGPSGPALDTKNFMTPSLVHDALYQLMRRKMLHRNFRKETDKLLVSMCKDEGMSWIRRQWVYAAVRFGGEDSSRYIRPIYEV